MVKKLTLFFAFLCFAYPVLFASDRTDAISLQKKSMTEAKILEVAVKNFGDDQDQKNYDRGLKLIKMGSLKLNQSKYLEASGQYQTYLKLQYQIYQSLAEKYLNRSQTLFDEVGLDLIDDSESKEVQKYFKIATQHIANAKKSRGMKHYNQVVESCRMAKKYIIQVYQLVGKPLPSQYKKDLADSNKKIF